MLQILWYEMKLKSYFKNTIEIFINSISIFDRVLIDLLYTEGMYKYQKNAYH